MDSNQTDSQELAVRTRAPFRLIVAVGVISTVPIYTNGALQFSLMRIGCRALAEGAFLYHILAS